MSSSTTTIDLLHDIRTAILRADGSTPTLLLDGQIPRNRLSLPDNTGTSHLLGLIVPRKLFTDIGIDGGVCSRFIAAISPRVTLGRHQSRHKREEEDNCVGMHDDDKVEDVVEFGSVV